MLMYEYPTIAKLGEAAGLTVGAGVTLALGLAPRDSVVRKPSQGDSPIPVVPIGSHTVERRHDAVYGPKITQYAQTLPDGALHDLVLSFGEGATLAPSVAYRLEAKSLKHISAVTQRR